MMSISEYDTITAVAAVTGVARSTIRDAVKRGEITTQRLAGGAVVVSVEDVSEWAKQERKLGRPRR